MTLAAYAVNANRAKYIYDRNGYKLFIRGSCLMMTDGNSEWMIHSGGESSDQFDPSSTILPWSVPAGVEVAVAYSTLVDALKSISEYVMQSVFNPDGDSTRWSYPFPDGQGDVKYEIVNLNKLLVADGEAISLLQKRSLEWLTSEMIKNDVSLQDLLRGPKGDKGDKGDRGYDGEDGEDGDGGWLGWFLNGANIVANVAEAVGIYGLEAQIAALQAQIAAIVTSEGMDELGEMADNAFEAFDEVGESIESSNLLKKFTNWFKSLVSRIKANAAGYTTINEGGQQLGLLNDVIEIPLGYNGSLPSFDDFGVLNRIPITRSVRLSESEVENEGDGEGEEPIEVLERAAFIEEPKDEDEVDLSSYTNGIQWLVEVVNKLVSNTKQITQNANTMNINGNLITSGRMNSVFDYTSILNQYKEYILAQENINSVESIDDVVNVLIPQMISGSIGYVNCSYINDIDVDLLAVTISIDRWFVMKLENGSLEWKSSSSNEWKAIGGNSEPIDLSGIEDTLSNHAERLTTLESVEHVSPETVGAIDERLTALENKECEIDTSEIEERLSVLEAIEHVSPEEVKGLNDRVTSLESIDHVSPEMVNVIDERLTKAENDIERIETSMDQHLGRITTLEGTVGYLGKIHWELKNDYDINMEDVKGRVEYLESSFSGFFDIMYPIGSIYMSMIKSPPPIGVWVLITNGKFLRSTTYDDDGGVEGGSNQFHLSEVNLPPHKHWFAGDEMTGQFQIRSSKHETINRCFGVFTKNGRGDEVWKTNLMHNSDDIDGCMTYEEVGFKATPSGTIGETGQGIPLSLPNPPYISCYMYQRTG